MAVSDELRARVDEILSKHRVVLFMKGSRRMPQCGFSQAVVSVLDRLLPTYETVNILADAELRAGMKEISNWPTFPQLFVDKNLVGGSDIVREMYAAGELHAVLGLPQPNPAKVPTLTLSQAAKRIIEQEMADGTDVLRLAISASHRPQLELGAKVRTDVVAEANGIAIHLDPDSAMRADGYQIDFVEGASGGFKITGPSQ